MFTKFKRRDPFNQNFRKFRGRIEWNGNFRKVRIDNFGQPLEVTWLLRLNEHWRYAGMVLHRTRNKWGETTRKDKRLTQRE